MQEITQAVCQEYWNQGFVIGVGITTGVFIFALMLNKLMREIRKNKNESEVCPVCGKWHLPLCDDAREPMNKG